MAYLYTERIQLRLFIYVYGGQNEPHERDLVYLYTNELQLPAADMNLEELMDPHGLWQRTTEAGRGDP